MFQGVMIVSGGIRGKRYSSAGYVPAGCRCYLWLEVYVAPVREGAECLWLVMGNASGNALLQAVAWICRGASVEDCRDNQCRDGKDGDECQCKYPGIHRYAVNKVLQPA